VEKHKQELEKISKTLQQVDLYNDDLRSKILVAKRTTLKAEESIMKQEAEKKRQVIPHPEALSYVINYI
jgi:coiled-coil domain-containing protein 40